MLLLMIFDIDSVLEASPKRRRLLLSGENLGIVANRLSISSRLYLGILFIHPSILYKTRPRDYETTSCSDCFAVSIHIAMDIVHTHSHHFASQLYLILYSILLPSLSNLKLLSPIPSINYSP